MKQKQAEENLKRKFKKTGTAIDASQ